MRKQFLTLLTILSCLSTQAQQEGPLMLVSSVGKIQYLSPGAKKAVKIAVGAALKPEGQIILGKNMKAVLICDGQFATTTNVGNNSLKELCEKGSKKLGMEYEFGNYVMDAGRLAGWADSKNFSWVQGITKARTGGDGWGTGLPQSRGTSGWSSGLPQSRGTSGWGTGLPQSRGTSGWGSSVSADTSGGSSSTLPPTRGRSGWGSNDAPIQQIMPFGKILADKTRFFWSNPGKYKLFHLEIVNEAGMVIFSADPVDSSLVVDLATLKLSAGDKFSWKVNAPANPKANASPLSCVIGENAKRLAAIAEADKISLLKAGDDPELKSLAEAVALEKAEWYYAANEIYLGLQKSGASRLTRMMHAAFWARNSFEPMAETAAMSKTK